MPLGILLHEVDDVELQRAGAPHRLSSAALEDDLPAEKSGEQGQLVGSGVRLSASAREPQRSALIALCLDHADEGIPNGTGAL